MLVLDRPARAADVTARTPHGLAEAGRYSARAMLACASFLVTPEPYMIRVDETVGYDFGEVRRSVSMYSVVPGPIVVGQRLLKEVLFDDGQRMQITDDDPIVELVPFPFKTAAKGDLTTILQIASGEGYHLNLLSHAEHESIARLMISEMLYAAMQPWLYLNFEVAREALRTIHDDLIRIPELDPLEAMAVVAHHFDRKTRQLKAWKSPLRPAREGQLVALCEILAESNILVAETTACVGEPFEVHYTELSPRMYREDPHRSRFALNDRQRQFLGGNAINLQLDVPLAGRTDDYHIYCDAPAGYYCTRQTASFSDSSASSKEIKVLHLLRHARDTQPRYQARSGPVTTAHVLIVNGTSTEVPLDVGLSFEEFPLGSAWPAFVASASTFLLISLLLLAKWMGHGQLGNASIPPLLVSFVSNSITLVSSLFATPRRSASILSRFILLLCAALGNLFSVWWLFNQYAPHEHNRGLQLLKIYSGYTIALFVLLITLIIFLRLRKIVRIYTAAFRRQTATR